VSSYSFLPDVKVSLATLERNFYNHLKLWSLRKGLAAGPTDRLPLRVYRIHSRLRRMSYTTCRHVFARRRISSIGPEDCMPPGSLILLARSSESGKMLDGIMLSTN